MKHKKLPLAFFRRRDVVQIGRELLGHFLYTRIGAAPLTGGIIVETEAYAGATDRASHAFGNRRTKRTEVMFLDGGAAYVYLCYGIHRLFNVVTNIAGVPDAVLIRALEPARGIDAMLSRRNKQDLDPSLTAGPGALAQALGIDLCHSGTSVAGNSIWFEPGITVAPGEIRAGPRVGVQYAGSDALKPWRFSLKTCARSASNEFSPSCPSCFSW